MEKGIIDKLGLKLAKAEWEPSSCTLTIPCKPENRSMAAVERPTTAQNCVKEERASEGEGNTERISRKQRTVLKRVQHMRV